MMRCEDESVADRKEEEEEGEEQGQSILCHRPGACGKGRQSSVLTS